EVHHRSQQVNHRAAAEETRLIGSHRMKSLLKWSAAGVIFTAALFSQSSGLKRTIVYKSDVSVPGREAVVARVELAPGIKAGRHTHPGDEISYVLEGQADI